MKSISIISASVLFALSTATANAAVTPAQAARLSQDLTPVGAERGPNADGSIPAWTGGITKIPANYVEGKFHPSPYAADKVQFTINASNYKQYAANLTEGQKALFELYPDTFKINVYPTRRSASLPEYAYQATIKNATSAQLIANGNGVGGATVGVPFPIPANGLEAIWNHILRFRGQQVSTERGQATPTASGAYNMVKMEDQVSFIYSRPDITAAELADKNLLFYFKQVVNSPARLAGTALLVHETLDQQAEPRKAWTYNTGQRRVRRAPNVAYDTPGTVSDGLRTTDDYDMYNGSPSRYNWTLVGKKEIYTPYNDYQVHSGDVSYDDILMPGHINPELVRYEKHRVWVVEADLKEGMRHIYKKRRFYLDEDSWQVAQVDIYDNRDQLYRVGNAHIVNYYQVPTTWTTLEVFHDLQSRRYIAMGLDNEDTAPDFNAQISDANFTSNALKRSGRR
ncbi:DUF1329 domain-containing protein [Paraferrimonas sp. SM1919]|uniref:DUF1329 domain-containing protein n=1 Tax=Paraferrimonas sp. SM1919 TaxID=2662263 RepID=UPI0013D31032|nr:DUF1329 domain-containing protein [Paraferrimonas sp. SM1919]